MSAATKTVTLPVASATEVQVALMLYVTGLGERIGAATLEDVKAELHKRQGDALIALNLLLETPAVSK